MLSKDTKLSLGKELRLAQAAAFSKNLKSVMLVIGANIAILAYNTSSLISDFLAISAPLLFWAAGWLGVQWITTPRGSASDAEIELQFRKGLAFAHAMVVAVVVWAISIRYVGGAAGV